MATSVQTRIEGAELHISSWACDVSKKFVAEDTLELLKFCFEGDINQKIPRQSIENIKSFEDLFSLVKNQRYGGNTEKALSRMIFLLDTVNGHRKYGKRSTALLKKFEIDKPERYVEASEPKIVQLHHCLAAIAVRLTPDHEDSIRNCFAGRQGINPESNVAKTILSLFRFLLHDKVGTHIQFIHSYHL